MIESWPLPGVPHHQAVAYDVNISLGCAPFRRRALQPTSQYIWGSAPNAEELASIERAIEEAASPPELIADLQEAWVAWHRRAEAAFQEAARLEVAVRITKSERRKGDPPRMRTTGMHSARRRPESIKMKRARRLHRAAAHQLRLGLGGKRSRPACSSPVECFRSRL